ncbi:IclR family transcriptional regulator [bacterium]|nr:MAG: IclR family transcriptional regulator [bacterium]
MNEPPIGEKEASSKQVIARAAAVLQALENSTTGMSLGQISKASGLPRTTVHRIVTALEAQQLVAVGTKGIRLGPALMRLAASAHTDITALVRPYIEELGQSTGETVDLGIFRGQVVIAIDQYQSEQELRVVLKVGGTYPVHCTPHGKVLLSQLSDEEVRALLDGPLLQSTPNSINSMEKLLEELAQIRRQGYAIDREEHLRGVCGVAVALETGLSERYSIAVAVPAVRFDEQWDVVYSALLQCKTQIEASLMGEPESTRG